jgi:hypothetical protein
MAQRYHSAQRDLQDRFDTRRLADRLAEATADTISASHRRFIDVQPSAPPDAVHTSGAKDEKPKSAAR